jgi:hypothetical protein
MTSKRCCTALLTAIFVAGCASQETAEQPPAAVAQAGDAAAAAPQTSDAGQAATAAETLGEVKTVNLKDMTQPNTGAICRQVLRQGSNVIVTQCMTPEGWKAYERWRTRNAQEMLRALQGSAYR